MDQDLHTFFQHLLNTLLLLQGLLFPIFLALLLLEDEWIQIPRKNLNLFIDWKMTEQHVELEVEKKILIGTVSKQVNVFTQLKLPKINTALT